ncbi:MAG: pilus (MSHA type) biogenesis protein MshL [Desulfobulbus propionicus]|nr:MAG: pilus (MSHA type) biogenesis protein MshL [Desulfobulbus propionicus]
MKLSKCSLVLFLMLTGAALSGCVNQNADSEPPETSSLEEKVTREAASQLPVRFQTPGYVAEEKLADEELAQGEDAYNLKVGATIRSTSGAQPLWDILNRLAALKGMSVSWAGDVDQKVLVDVNIAADDDFFTAIDNMLRQVEYYQEVEGNTIVVKYRDTRKYYISVPHMKGSYTSTVGGNYLTDRDAATGTEGTVKITSDENEFNLWQNIQTNIDTIMQQWTTVASGADAAQEEDDGEEDVDEEAAAEATRRISGSGSYYTIDESIGLITVTAPRPLLDKIDLYINTLKKELFRQVVIEAKIIEVYLQDNSKIGLDWSGVLKDFDITGTTFFGTGGSIMEDANNPGSYMWGDGDGVGQVYPWIPAEGDNDSITTFVSRLTMNPVNFTVMLNALNEQGDATVLSNPKITVLNGQPALISVGTDITYVKEIEADRDTENNTITYTVEADSVVEGIALGVLATIVDDDSVILHLTPVTTDLVEDPIEYRTIGNDGVEIGLPRVRVRDMSTMVEVKNGEMLVIGGLIDSVEGKESAFAPLVGNIPIIKYLFGYEEKQLEKRELVILLTPRII